MQTRLITLPLTLLATGCLGPNPYLDGADELGVIEDGVLWCAQTADAIAYFETSQIGIWENQTGPAPLIDPTG